MKTSAVFSLFAPVAMLAFCSLLPLANSVATFGAEEADSWSVVQNKDLPHQLVSKVAKRHPAANTEDGDGKHKQVAISNPGLRALGSGKPGNNLKVHVKHKSFSKMKRNGDCHEYGQLWRNDRYQYVYEPDKKNGKLEIVMKKKSTSGSIQVHLYYEPKGKPNWVCPIILESKKGPSGCSGNRCRASFTIKSPALYIRDDGDGNVYGVYEP